ncbi:hypothetical protein ACF1HJ_32875 [Streptomyces sp. NPDC013978]|uniref:hypothetical protein n=1 Tax=Streptomyces sp. NPDC013978 TaxID=3364869 RepID=UPI0036FA3134
MTNNDGTLVGGTCGVSEYGVPCGNAIRTRGPVGPQWAQVPVCEKHAAVLTNWNVGTYRTLMLAEMEKRGLISGHLPGYTYVIWLPNDRVKIGSVGREDRLLKRWKEITADYVKAGHKDPIKPIAVFDGGKSKEAAVQGRFNHLRVQDELGEQFSPDPELIDHAENQGIPTELAYLIPSYEKWWDRYAPKKGIAVPTSKDDEARRAADDDWLF